MTKRTIDPSVSGPLSARMIEHIRFHSTRLDLPTLYQFELPDDCLLSVEDQVTSGFLSNGERVLIGWVVTGISNGYNVFMLPRPAGASAESAWFDGATPAEMGMYTAKFVEGIEWAHRNRHLNMTRRRFAALIDPNSEPAPIPQPPAKRTGTLD